MKKLLLAGLGLAAVALLAVPMFNLLDAPPEVAFTGPEAAPAVPEVGPVLAEKCADCHTTEGRRPFYAALPVVGDLIQRDVADGLSHLDLNRALTGEGPVAETTLARIEYVIRQGSMPPTRYLALHWDAAFTEAERAALLSWVREQRATHHAAEGLPASVRGLVVRPIPAPPEEDARVALGARLFHDPRLSGDDSLSCASCHSLTQGGTDQRPVSVGIGGAKGPINSPTVFNAVFNRSQFWDGRAADLVEQAAGPVHNPIEMGSNWEQVIGKLGGDAGFVEDYRAVYGDEITGENLQDAIAAFEATLVTPNAPFDRFLLGDEDALGETEQAGWAVFQQAGCVTCHVGEALGGQSFEVLGVHADYFGDLDRHLHEVDDGRFNVTHDEGDRHRFKVPTLRNVEVTAPYFHDASAASLEEAVRAMAHYQTEADLTDVQVDSVVAFLRSLTGEYRGERLN